MGTLILQGDIQVTGDVLIDSSGVVIPVANALTDSIYSCPAKDFVSQNGKTPTIASGSDIIINGIVDGIGQGFPPNEGPGANSKLLDSQFNLSNIYGANHAGIGYVQDVPGGTYLLEEYFTVNSLNIMQKNINLPYRVVNNTVAVNVIDGPSLALGIDFNLVNDTISWSGTPTDLIIAEGDILRVIYLADTFRYFLGPKKTYGSYEAPTSLGSGSGETFGGSGIKLEARTGTVTLAGTIDVDGESGTSTRTGGGSGGSVWVSAYKIDGTGSISAGGGGASYEYAGGGSGGYITLNHENLNTFNGPLSVAGQKGSTKGLITEKKIEPFFTDKFTGTILNTKWWEVTSDPVTLNNAINMDTTLGDYRSSRLESLFEISGDNIKVDLDYVPVGSPPYSYHSSYFNLYLDDTNWVSISKKYDYIYGMYSVDGSITQGSVLHGYNTTPTTFRIQKDQTNFSFQYIDTTNLPVTFFSDTIPEFENKSFKVAVGNDVGSPGLWVSTNAGLTWVSKSLNDSFNSVSVSRDGVHQIAVAISGNVYNSDDSGNTWIVNAAAPNHLWWACKTSIHGKYQYISYGRDDAGGGFIYRSDDTGQTWSKIDPIITPSMQRRWQRICMSDYGQYVSACVHNWTTNSIAYSVDYGLTWAYSKSPTTDNLFSVVRGSGLFVTVGDTGNIFSSNDGVLWTDASSSVTGNNLQAVTYGTGYIAVGELGTIITSPDGATWANKISGTGNNLRSVIYGSSRYVTVGDSGTILSSSDTTTWVAQTSGTPNNLWESVLGNNKYVVVGDSGTILTSTDTTAWTSRVSGTVESLQSVAYGSGRYITVGTSGTILASSDSTTWTSRTSGTSSSLNAVAYVNSRYVTVGDSGTILVSTDSTTWVSMDAGTTENLQYIAYGSSRYVAVGSNGAVVTSSDSSTWSRVGVPAYDWADIICTADGKYQYATSDTRTVWSSKDYGASWSRIKGTWNTNQRWNTITTSDSGQYLTITAHDTLPHDPGNGLIYRSDDYGATFTTRMPTGIPMDWNGATMTGLGDYQVVFLYGHTMLLGHLWESRDYGDTWVQNMSTPEIEWAQVAMSSDGSHITAVGFETQGSYNASIHWDNFKVFEGIVNGAETLSPTLYVDPIYGSDSSDGGALSPLKNLFVATSWAKRNGTVVLYNGQHNPTEIVNKNLTILGANGANASISTVNSYDASGSNWENSCLTFRDCQGLVKNVKLTHAREAILAQNVKDFEVNSCVFEDSSTGISVIDYSKDCRIIGNTFYDTSEAVYFGYQNFNPLIYSNVMYDCSTGVKLLDASNFVVSSNTFDSLETCVVLDETSKGAIASNNLTESSVGVLISGDSTVGLFNNNYYLTNDPLIFSSGLITDDTNFTYGQPAYKNQFLKDYGLLSSSANIGAGTGRFDTVYLDRNKNKRYPSYDIGAYQYTDTVNFIGDHYVDASGSDLNNGDITGPYLTIDKAMTVSNSPVYISSNARTDSQGAHFNSYFLDLKEQNIYFVDASRQLQTYTLDSHYSNIDISRLIFVSPNGSDGTTIGGDGTETGGNGTVSLPYRSLGWALQNSSAGNYLIALSGEYQTFNGKNNRLIVPMEDMTGVPDGRVYLEDLFYTPLTVYPNHNIDETSWYIV